MPAADHRRRAFAQPGMPVTGLSDQRVSRGPDRAVVGEVDDPGIELLESIDPRRDAGQRLTMTVPVGSPGELVGGILRRGVVALPATITAPSARRTISDW